MTFRPLKKRVEKLLDLSDVISEELLLDGKSYVFQFVSETQQFKLVESVYYPPSVDAPIVNLDNVQDGEILVYRVGEWVNIPEDDILSYQNVLSYPLIAESSILYILGGSGLRDISLFENDNEYFLFKDANTINSESDYITITTPTYTFENGTNSYMLTKKGDFVQFRNVANILVRV